MDDYFTKPLQGKMFNCFRDLIMGYVNRNDVLQANELSAEERVEKSKNTTVNEVTNNRKIGHDDVCKASTNIMQKKETEKVY